MTVTRQIGSDYKRTLSGWVRYDVVSSDFGREREMIFCAGRSDQSGAYLEAHGMDTYLNGRQECSACFLNHSHTIEAHAQVAARVASSRAA